MDEQTEKSYHDRIILGEDARNLLGKDAVNDIIKSCQDDIDCAVEEFMDVDPHDTKAIVRLQQEIRVASRFPQWINEKILAGSSAFTEYRTLKEMEKEDKEGVGE